MKPAFLLLLAVTLGLTLYGQPEAPFEIQLEAVEIEGLGGLQSYAVGTHNGRWLIIGGRLDGLHRRQPWASFDLAGHNNQLFVVDPEQSLFWTAPLSDLPLSIAEQLSSTNMEFYQDGEELYIVGGYGYSPTAEDHITYPYLTLIDVPATIEAITDGQAFASYFQQISDEQLAVTGGRLEKIYDTFYLVGGHRFDGRYNPMGHGTHTQTYTNAVRRFRLEEIDDELLLDWLPSWEDEEHLHRRDFNVVPQIMPSGEEGLTAFSGVFQPDVNLPFLNCVNIDSSGYTVNNDFVQYYNHYHCANIPLYSTGANEMHTLFFGGIAQFYDMDGDLIQDDNVPFVPTIARVTRTADGTMTEHKLPLEMPALLGAGAEFVFQPDLPRFPNGVIDLDELGPSTELGYIYGGISSSGLNIFWINDGTQSSANHQLFRVILTKNPVSDVPAAPSQGGLNLELSPNPSSGLVTVQFKLPYTSKAKISVTGTAGQRLRECQRRERVFPAGEYRVDILFDESGIFIVTLETLRHRISRKVVISQ